MTKNKNEVGMSAEPVVPGEGRPELDLWLMAQYGSDGWWQVWRGHTTLVLENKAQACAVRDALNAVARPALPAPPDDDALLVELHLKAQKNGFQFTAVEQRLIAEIRRLRAALPAPEPPPGPWRVAQNAGATPQPRYVEYWEGPRLEQYGARWVPNGFPSAEEAQAVCDALNRMERK